MLSHDPTITQYRRSGDGKSPVTIKTDRDRRLEGLDTAATKLVEWWLAKHDTLE